MWSAIANALYGSQRDHLFNMYPKFSEKHLLPLYSHVSVLTCTCVYQGVKNVINFLKNVAYVLNG